MPPRRQPPKVPRPDAVPTLTGPAILALEQELRDLDPSQRAARCERFWEGTAARTPLIERSPSGSPVVTFLWRSSEASSVLAFVNRLTDETDVERSLLRRVPGSDVWHLSYEVSESWRGSYGFIEHHGDGAPPWNDERIGQRGLRSLLDGASADPRCSIRCSTRDGRALSVAEMPGAPEQRWRDIAAAAAPWAELRETTGPDGRRCWLYGAPRTDDGPAAAAPRTLWVVLDGEVWGQHHGLGAVLEALQRSGEARGLCALFIDSGGVARRWEELGEPAGFIRTLAEQYLPWARERFGERFHPAECGIVGQSIGGLAALHAALQHPETFGLAIAQSASLWLETPATAEADRRGQRIRIEVGSEEWALLEPNRALATRLAAAADGPQIDLREFSGGHDYACWRGGLADGILALSSP